MKKGIHPEYKIVNVSCTCGNNMKIGTTMQKDYHLDVCSACHPFYTGQQRIMDTGGRIDKFKQRFGSIGSKATK